MWIKCALPHILMHLIACWSMDRLARLARIKHRWATAHTGLTRLTAHPLRKLRRLSQMGYLLAHVQMRHQIGIKIMMRLWWGELVRLHTCGAFREELIGLEVLPDGL